MADTAFTDGVTLSAADWFNDLNRLHYTLLQDPNAAYYLCDGRLTLTTGVPVTTGDVTGAGTIFYAPFRGSKIALYDGSTNWKAYNFTQLSLALTLASGKPYDIFCFDNSGTPTLESLVWTDDTNRATALTTQNGVLVKSGATTRRYLGTIYASGSNTTEDSLLKRYVWNYYNRVERTMQALEGTDSWAYTVATYQQANASTANQFDYVQGFSEEPVTADVMAAAANSNVGVAIAVGIGVDSTTVNSAQRLSGFTTNAVNQRVVPTASYRGYPGVGKHKIVWIEKSAASGTTTWSGDAGDSTFVQSGITGKING